MGKFSISRRANGEFQFNLKASNNEVILTSEGYSSMKGCLTGVQSVRENSGDDTAYARMSSSNGRCYFNLKARNQQVIGTSELYESPYAREKGIDSVKGNAPSAPVEYFEMAGVSL
jgi:uncharacterized protein YegP (UPF0339 family)